MDLSTIDLFGCNELSMAGIKELRLATRNPQGNPLVFPIDLELKTNDDSIVVVSIDELNKEIISGVDEIQYRQVYPLHASLTEDEIQDRQGRFFEQLLSFELPMISLNTNNQLKSFLFTTSGEFAISTMICFIVDMNDVHWVCGYHQPMILETFEIQSGAEGEDSKYVITYKCKSYSKIRQVEYK